MDKIAVFFGVIFAFFNRLDRRLLFYIVLFFSVLIVFRVIFKFMPKVLEAIINVIQKLLMILFNFILRIDGNLSIKRRLNGDGPKRASYLLDNMFTKIINWLEESKKNINSLRNKYFKYKKWIRALALIICVIAYAKPNAVKIYSNYYNSTESWAVKAAYERFNVIRWSDISASSTKNEALGTNQPKFASDDDLTTSWVPGKNNKGTGEWINFKSSKPVKISEIVIVNGNRKSEGLYNSNNRVKKLQVTFSNGSSQVCDLADSFSSNTTINFKDAITTNEVKFTVLEIYPGGKSNDTYLSEIYVIGSSK